MGIAQGYGVSPMGFSSPAYQSTQGTLGGMGLPQLQQQPALSHVATQFAKTDAITASMGTTGWLPGAANRMFTTPAREQGIQAYTTLLQNPYAMVSVAMVPAVGTPALTPPNNPPVFPAIEAHCMAQYHAAGSSDGPAAWEVFLTSFAALWEHRGLIKPAPAIQKGYAVLQWRLEAVIKEAGLDANAVLVAMQEAYTSVAQQTYAAGFMRDFWSALPTTQANVLASIGCNAAERVMILCEQKGYNPPVDTLQQQQQMVLRLQAVKGLEGAKHSKDAFLASLPPPKYKINSQMLEALSKDFRASLPHSTTKFILGANFMNPAMVVQAIQLCQQHDCPVSMRQAIMFYMQTSTTNMYGDLKAWKNFQDGRFRRAHTILRTRQLKPTDARLIALALGRPSSAGIRSPFSDSHCVTLQVKKDSDMSLEQIYMGWTKESELIRQFGWAINQPCEDYHDIIQEFRMIYDELSSSQSTSKSPLAVVGRFRELITTLIDFRAELVGKYASEYVVLHAPYPSLYTCAHLRSNYEHEPYFRNFIDSVVTRTRKIVVEETNPVYKASPADSAQGVNFAKIVAQSNSALASLQKQVQSLTTAAAAGKVSTQQQQAALKASKTAAQALKAAAAAVPGSVVPPAKAKRGTPPTVSPPNQKGANPVPPSPAKKTAKQIKYDAAAALRLAQANGGGGGGAGSGTDAVKPGTQLIPVPRFKSTKLRTEEEGKKWDYPPWAYTSNGFSVPGSLVHDWFHDILKYVGREHLCWYDVCGTRGGCGNPLACYSMLDPSRLKDHPNGQDEMKRITTRAHWAEACAVDAAAGYLGYGT